MNPPSKSTIIPSKQSKNMNNNHAFLTTLPQEIIIDILSRLPNPTLATCKCVSRKLRGLISGPDFAHLHLSRPAPGLIFHQSDSCKIFEFVDELGLQHHDLHYNQVMEFDPRSFITSPNAAISLVGGSVNGLICLHDLDSKLDALYICNPFTREYVTLPRTKEAVQYPNFVSHALGVSSPSGLYKVVRISHEPVNERAQIPGFECLVYTLGTGSWRSIEPGGPFEFHGYSNCVFMNGNLHWLAGNEEGKQVIACFDLETELFKPFCPPAFTDFFPMKGSLVDLGGCLCLCDCSTDQEIVIWVMKEYGVEQSWTKEYVIDKEIGDLGGLSYEAVLPIKAFKDGELLLLWENCCLFYYASKTETAPEVDLFRLNQPGRNDVMLHTSSSASLKRFALENVGWF